MRKITAFSLILSLAGLLALSSCNQGKFEKLPNGVEYKFITQNKKNPKIKEGDIVRFHVVVKNHKDSVVFDTYAKNSQGPQQIYPFPPEKDLNIILTPFKLFAEGDSIVFRVKTDTLLGLSMKQVQEATSQMEKQLKMLDTLSSKNMDEKAKTQQREGIKAQMKKMDEDVKKLKADLPKGKYNQYIVKVLLVSDPEKERKKAEEQAKKQKETDKKLIADYAQKKKIKPTITASGLNYVITQEGSGETPKPNDVVKVNYVGKLLDGKVFDTSYEKEAKAANVYNKSREYKPLEFPLGTGSVIRGWDEGIALLKKGGKATLIIPSEIAYGQQNLGTIPANSVLVFEVELVDFTKGKPQTTQPAPNTPTIK
ncbi:MAG: FKBP-type peptidyl-prolyl cis-trans isomerase [Microscillaceae bacterium]|jgi:FKBP-type peptidyl-prolyl cis-trans isomerase|nr:FKBP-type peptidyl-prolyl cis-trans isomerase [Microscillaceae bacterium]